MKQSSKMGLLFLVASLLSVLSFPYNPLVIFKVIEPNNIKVLWYIGWIFWAVGIALIIPSYYYLFYRKVKTLIDSGIYAIVRHPLYLGWILAIFVATILFYQHWLFGVIAIPGIASVYSISRQEERLNIERFGDDYKRYMQSVPRMNLFAGAIRLAQRRRRE